MKVLIDADVICYESAAEASRNEPITWEEGVVQVPNNLDKAIEIAGYSIEQWILGAEALYETPPETPTTFILCWSGVSEDNFRREVYPLYKSNRTVEKPPQYAELRKYLESTYPSLSCRNLEGDDVLGLLGTEDTDADRIVMSTDKDIKTLPCKILHVKNRGELRFEYRDADLEAANLFWMTQTIVGDNTDGYKGSPGAGIVAAEKALKDVHTLPRMWKKVLDVYRAQFNKPKQYDKFYTKSVRGEALMNARCARILRYGDYDWLTGEVELWNP
jgi:DNA polymerase-1